MSPKPLSMSNASIHQSKGNLHSKNPLMEFQHLTSPLEIVPYPTLSQVISSPRVSTDKLPPYSNEELNKDLKQVNDYEGSSLKVEDSKKKKVVEALFTPD